MAKSKGTGEWTVARRERLCYKSRIYEYESVSRSAYIRMRAMEVTELKSAIVDLSARVEKIRDWL
jgi:hypothetical protein